MGSESSLLQSSLDLKGTFAMASAPANEPAMAPKGQKHTAFSGELIKVLQEGIESEKEELTLKEIFEHILREFRRRTDVPEPQCANMQDAGKIVFARNQRFEGDINKRLDALEKKIDAHLADQEKRIQQLVLDMQSGAKLAKSNDRETFKELPFSLRFITWCINAFLVGWPAVTCWYVTMLTYGRERVPELYIIFVLVAALEAGIILEAFGAHRRGRSLFFPHWYQPLHAFRASALGLIVLVIAFLVLRISFMY